MRLHGRVALVGLMLAAAGCGDDDDGTAGKTDEHTAQLVAASLTSNVVFEDGVVQLGEIPDSSEDTVSLAQEDQVLSLAPGEAQILALEVDNPDEEDDPVTATLMQFEGEEDAHHVEVPRKGGGDGGTGDGGAADSAINIDFNVDGDVCTDLCNDTFTITMIQAVKLRRGGVSKHLKRTIKLDCSKKGDPDKCESKAEPSGGKGGSGAKDGGTSGSSGKGGSGASGSGSTQTPATLAEEFARVLGNDNLAVCMCEMPGTAAAMCVGFIPQTKVACIRDWIRDNGTSDDLGPLNDLAGVLMSIQGACMSCDTTTCGPTTLADNISDLTDAAQAAFMTCGVEAGAKPVDAGAAP